MMDPGTRLRYSRTTTQEALVAFHPDGTRLASGSEDCTIKLWDLDSKRCVTTLRGQHEWRILDLDFSDDDDRLVSVTRHGEMALWDTLWDTREPTDGL